MNEELINSAVSFLRDPNVASAALTKKVEFLESKGLNQEEIEEALKRVNEPESSSSSSITPSTSNTTTTSLQQAPQQLPIDYYNVAPPVPERSWKDYFIMATATAGVTYGLYQIVTKYLVPSIIPPSQSSIEQDKEVINEEFIKIDKILEQLTKEQEEIKTANEEKLKDIDTVIENINDFLARYNRDKFNFDDNLKLMRLEIDNLSNSIEKNMKLNKEDVNYELVGLKDELQSLKNLIQVRGASSSSSGATAANGASNNTGRTIAPVSSIPSASEILKRAKTKNETPATSSPTTLASSAASAAPVAKQTTSTSSTASTPKDEAVIPEVPADRAGGWSVGKVSSAGIPAWQMKHREEELKEGSSGDKDLASVIPAWQKDQAKSEAEIDDKIKSAGIPPWQLPLAANKSDDKSEEKNSGIPSWQSAASTTNV
ncbi:Pex14 protein [Candida orthopsilosis Co 90-125]|uniref:Peroxisomal membrane protein PEX14 n=1 Tax=Candida orthopsilosis (strain 90-125) TaxID=1136231 RepID=H8X5Z4_CANO9|nr:Pex14 protein [Candida orthopsilosis Co 90-125]CCG23242.1 Pex14 protein [Candida orthopsilosis Co 90-125]